LRTFFNFEIFPTQKYRNTSSGATENSPFSNLILKIINDNKRLFSTFLVDFNLRFNYLDI